MLRLTCDCRDNISCRTRKRVSLGRSIASSQETSINGSGVDAAAFEPPGRVFDPRRRRTVIVGSVRTPVIPGGANGDGVERFFRLGERALQIILLRHRARAE